MKALCLLSGGLDSTIAGRIVLDLGFEVEALHFVTVFCTCTPQSAGCSAAVTAARQLGIPVRTINVTDEFLKVVKNPPHGYGKLLNPCLDCRILMFRRALAMLKEAGASFLVTGEVLGERPMSQRLASMLLIEREAGAQGLILRPLSARLMPPSVPETEGWVDRTRLLAISGRSRRPQISMAERLGIHDYPCPAGGCRLTDPGFAGRMKDLLDHDTRGVSAMDATLLRWGRHFRLSPAAKAIVGRNEEENARLRRLASGQDAVMEPTALPGPTTIVSAGFDGDDLELAGKITAFYTDRAVPDKPVQIEVHLPHQERQTVLAQASRREDVARYRVRPLQKGWRQLVGGAERSGHCAARH